MHTLCAYALKVKIIIGEISRTMGFFHRKIEINEPYLVKILCN